MGIDFKRPRHVRGFRFGETLVWDFTSRPLVEKTVSGSIVTFSDGADAVPLKKCEITLPASLDGYSEVDVVATGKNLLGMTERASSTTNGITSTISANNTITASGTSSGNGDISFDLDVDLVLKSEVTYTISFTGTDERSGTLNIYLREKGGSYKSPLALGASAHSRQISGIDGTIDRILLRTSNNNTITMNAQLQIEVGSSASDFEPYTAPTTHTADLGRTIYGGSVDVVAGEGQSSYKIITVGNSGWNYYSAGGYIYRDFADKVVPEIGDSDHVLVTDNPDMPYGGVNYASQFQDLHIYQANNPAIYIKDTSCTSLNDFYTKYSNMKIGYELATPETFTFDPVPIDSKLGNNTMWSEQGSIEVIYYAYAD